MVLLIAACGSRVDSQKLLAAQRGGATGSVAASQEQGGLPASQQEAGAGDVQSGPAAAPGQSTAGPAVSSEGAVAGSLPQGSSGQSSQACETKAPLVIGSVGTLSGLVGSIVGDQVKAVQAWVASVNAKGGLHCHPVKLVVADDGNDPSRHQALVQKLVEQDHVIAFIQLASPQTGQASVNYLTQKRIPVLGGDGGDYNITAPFRFPVTPQGAATNKMTFAATVAAGKAEGKTKYGVVYCIEVQNCSDAYDRAPTWGKEYGVDVVYRAQGSIAQPDFTAICQGARQAGAEVLSMNIDGASMQRIARSCRAVNYQPIFAGYGTTFTNQILQDPNLEGLYGGVPTTPWFLVDNKMVAEQVQALRQYSPNTPPSGWTMYGWVSGELLRIATANLPDIPTSEAILDALFAVKDNDLGGNTMNLTFTKDQDRPRQFCFWLIQVRKGQYVDANNNVRTCGVE